ncbi:MAG: galactitol-1-phosphate 5-dehydrogenase [Planctomycetota bacterium]
MKALLLTGERELEVTDFPDPELGPRDVLVRVNACGICGSDVHGYDGSTGRRRPPLVMGHEAAGTVAELGRDVVGLSVGQAVTFDSTVSCGVCDYCRAGRVNLCSNRQVLGVSCEDYRRHGAFAEFVAVPSHIVYPLPQGMDFAEAAMIEAVSVAVHAVDRTPIPLGKRVAVIGAGMIGLLTVQALRLRGCSKIACVDLDDTRLDLARSYGATDTVNSGETDAVAALRELTGGEGVDATFECVGAPPTVNAAIEGTRKGGDVTLVGNLAPTVEFPLQSVVTREMTVRGSCASAGEYPACIDLIAGGQIRVADLISARSSLDDAPDWFDRLYGREPGLMKVIVEPGI